MPGYVEEHPERTGRISDIRPGTPEIWYIRSDDATSCDNSDVMAYVTSRKLLYDQPLLTICPHSFAFWSQAYNLGQSLSTAAKMDWYVAPGAQGTKRHIDTMYNCFLTSVLLHELTHINPMAHNDEITKKAIISEYASIMIPSFLIASHLYFKADVKTPRCRDSAYR